MEVNDKKELTQEDVKMHMFFGSTNCAGPMCLWLAVNHHH